MTVRSGSAEWHGNVESGSGTVTVGDGVFKGAYSYDSRFGEGKGTNPEQLIAAAHASCFTMALSNILSAAGHPPESLRTNARVQLRNIDGAPTLARINLDTGGRVTGVDEQQFRAYADEAKRVCPVALALKQAGETFGKLGVQLGGSHLDFPAANEWKAAVVKRMTGGVAFLFRANGVTCVIGPRSRPRVASSAAMG